ncbi:hypothetical protein OH76DRAFT_1488995 [Lentinus brumalis]|uniref:Uncharacterized protein n=1 Tax=Lentinus brumalis TaxID=2498619 RepID=A0A371CP69_9APHY|nr:hypothetical protein OH76DRAFT_1488995 [Polyporus brumalis]
MLSQLLCSSLLPPSAPYCPFPSSWGLHSGPPRSLGPASPSSSSHSFRYPGTARTGPEIVIRGRAPSMLSVTDCLLAATWLVAGGCSSRDSIWLPFDNAGSTSGKHLWSAMARGNLEAPLNCRLSAQRFNEYYTIPESPITIRGALERLCSNYLTRNRPVSRRSPRRSCIPKYSAQAVDVKHPWSRICSLRAEWFMRRLWRSDWFCNL